MRYPQHCSWATIHFAFMRPQWLVWHWNVDGKTSGTVIVKVNESMLRSLYKLPLLSFIKWLKSLNSEYESLNDCVLCSSEGLLKLWNCGMLEGIVLKAHGDWICSARKNWLGASLWLDNEFIRARAAHIRQISKELKNQNSSSLSFLSRYILIKNLINFC